MSLFLASALMTAGIAGCTPPPSDKGEADDGETTSPVATDQPAETSFTETTAPETDAAETTEAETTPNAPETVKFTQSKVAGRYPNQLTMTAEAWSLSLGYSESGVRFAEGRFGDMTVSAGSVFSLSLRDTQGKYINLTSAAKWATVEVSYDSDTVTIRLSDPSNITGIAVELTGQTDERGISWSSKVVNESETYTVMDMTYPTPEMKGDVINVFLPERSGRMIQNAHEVGCSMTLDYPGHLLSMPYFAYWGEHGGIYLGVHDSAGSMKSFSTNVNRNRVSLTATFPAIGAGNVGNSFEMGGCIRWEVFEGDWYDATRIYADFVHNHAEWLPEKNRPDTDDKFKEIAMWLVDNAWDTDLQAILQIREQMGYPIAVHSYVWHEIAFDTYYPHFMPAKSNTVDRFNRMREADIYVMPYINAVSWGTLDTSQGYEVNYDNTGIAGVARYPDGSAYVVPYANPLAVMCPYFTTWRDIMKQLVRDMEAQLPIDGVYYDQIAAVAPIPCSDPTHGHVTGGGSYWSDGYNDMMLDIISGRPTSSFYFSESTGETYVKTFDGLLSWMWNLNDMVPAFPMVYAGYIQMVGRNSDAIGTENAFRYHFGEAMLFGQQPGWCAASQFLSAPQSRIDYMKQIVDVRMQYIDLFNYGKLMRPPVVETEIAPIDGYRQVISGVWQNPEDGKTVLFVINVSEQAATATLGLYPEEYGVDCEASMTVELEPISIQVIELN